MSPAVPHWVLALALSSSLACAEPVSPEPASPDHPHAPHRLTLSASQRQHLEGLAQAAPLDPFLVEVLWATAAAPEFEAGLTPPPSVA